MPRTKPKGQNLNNACTKSTQLNLNARLLKLIIHTRTHMSLWSQLELDDSDDLSRCNTDRHFSKLFSENFWISVPIYETKGSENIATTLRLF